ncbi:PepSY domain-containing protein [Alkalilimnicola sp. S0819]|uniref:PepSY domain-containing protein n=1 Tax=Alkalilimnicola sp. S0819 TaxID=2613922 RepID=UPI001261E1F2|nr:hypothetical protein [Alkalilimnicola sp. S0819]KAB7623920.1 hypothetical protein F3N43_07685 [Alkalilimnicola sp. S0819]MPQ16516.1 hypothetical protein [Alkalilimnicola sp. S0819]
MKKTLCTFLLSFALLLLPLGAVAQAAAPVHPGGGQGDPPAAERDGARAAAAWAQRKYGGRVLALRTVEGRGGTHYRIKLLSGDGRVRVVRVPAD